MLININQKYKCSMCEGKGHNIKQPDGHIEKCKYCYGTGYARDLDLINQTNSPIPKEEI